MCLLTLILGAVFVPFLYTSYEFPEPREPNDLNSDAVDWVIKNLPKNSTIVVYDFNIADLREAGFYYVTSLWFLDEGVLEGDAKNIDYFIGADLYTFQQYEFMEPATRNATLIKTLQLENHYEDYYNIYQVN